MMIVVLVGKFELVRAVGQLEKLQSYWPVMFVRLLKMNCHLPSSAWWLLMTDSAAMKLVVRPSVALWIASLARCQQARWS
jgi:hypothetical protein